MLDRRNTMTFEIECEYCEKNTSFEIKEVVGLGDHIDGEVEAAEDAVREEYSHLVDPDDMLYDTRLLHDLAIAIRKGDVSEGKYLLDKLAQDFGNQAVEAVERGWFNPLAQAAA